MVKELPVRSDAVRWSKSTDPVYSNRNIWETPLEEGFAKTTLKRIVIVEDPHIKDAPNRAPITQPIDTQVNVGKYANQEFSGELSLGERAHILVKYDKLYKAIVEALENANSIESQTSDLGDKVLDFLF